ncbi:hypothetical protein B1201_02525 [Acinetobacter sp. ANC 5600]|nr:hypothetical protein B1201_02525 [Acinetobacter sp. ANC 5600]
MNEELKYAVHNSSSKTCSGEFVSKRYQLLHDMVISEIQPAATLNNFEYHAIKFQPVRGGATSNRVLTFLNNHSFCVINATISNPSYIIMQRGLITDPLKDSRCYTKNSNEFFTNLKPKTKITAADFKSENFINTTDTVNFLTQLNTMGQSGYKLIGYDTKTLDNGNVNSYMKLANENTRFNHIVADRTAPSIADIYFTWRNQLNEKGKSGYQYLHSVRPTNALNFKDYFIKKENDTATYTYDSGYVSPLVDPVQLETMLNTLGAQGCRIIQFKSYYTGFRPEILNGKQNSPKVATCINSSAHHGTYSYRYKTYPTGSNSVERSIKLQEMIDEQAKDGYRLVSRALDMSSTTKNGMLFMKDSENTNVGEFKVFSETVFATSTFNDVLLKRLQQQGQLGWLYTSGQLLFANNPKHLQTELSDFNLID